MKIIFAILFLLPAICSADLINKVSIGNGNYLGEFAIGNGIRVWQVILGGVIKAHAGEMTEEESNIQIIKTWADWYDQDRKYLQALAKCESGYDSKAFNPNDPKGGAYGLFQFLRPTFNSFKKTAKLPDLVYESPSDQARLTAWAHSKGLEKHWFNCRYWILNSRWPK